MPSARCAVEPGAAGGGRRLVATAPAAAGDTLLAEPALAAVPTRDDGCWLSLEAGAGARCGGCRVARYSTRAAQRLDWPAHRPECAAIVAMGRAPPPSVRLAARVMRAVQKGGAAAAAVEPLVDHWDALPSPRRLSLATAAAGASSFMRAGGGDEPPPAGDLARALARLAANAHTVADPELRPLGVALFPGAAMANHDDAPTAAQVFGVGADGAPTIRFVALRALTAGDDVSIAYVDLLAPRPERRAALLSGYCFDLDAGRAADPSPAAEWRGDGIAATAHASRPPSADDGRSDTLDAVAGVPGCGVVAWAEASAADGGATAPPPLARVTAFGPALTDPSRLESVARAAAAMVRAADAGRGADPPTVLALTTAALAAAAAAPLAPAPGSILHARLADAAAHAAVACGDYSAAAAHAAAALPATLAAHPPGAPPRALALATLAKLLAYVGRDDRKALEAAVAAERDARVALAGTPAHAEVAALVRGLTAELAAETE
jgi:hypothetical protein